MVSGIAKKERKFNTPGMALVVFNEGFQIWTVKESCRISIEGELAQLDKGTLVGAQACKECNLREDCSALKIRE